MPLDIHIRRVEASDLTAVEQLYLSAFPDEDLLPLVRSLAGQPDVAIGWVGLLGGEIIGHIVFTRCAVEDILSDVYLLGPLAVAPKCQRNGVGKRLIESGLEGLRTRNGTRVFVLGDPAYYSRIGFVAEKLLKPPFDLPADWDGAWQSQSLAEEGTGLSGSLIVPPVWNKRELWAP